MVHQLRIYEIFETSKAAFHDRFRDHAARIMVRHGFDIRHMWEGRHQDRTEFVYLIAWPDAATAKAGWEAFMADPEWLRVKRETNSDQGPLVGAIEDRILSPVPYEAT